MRNYVAKDPITVENPQAIVQAVAWHRSRRRAVPQDDQAEIPLP
jgi:hypothetical protein